MTIPLTLDSSNVIHWHIFFEDLLGLPGPEEGIYKAFPLNLTMNYNEIFTKILEKYINL